MGLSGGTMPTTKSNEVVMHKGTRDGLMQVMCWCESEMVKVAPEVVRKGRTGSCGKAECHG